MHDYYHAPSPISYCWEIKAIAYNINDNKG